MRPEDPLPPPATPPQPLVTQPVREQDKIYLVLSYLGLLALLPLFLVKDSAFVQWHAKQGLTLSVGMFVLFVVFNVIPYLGCLVSGLLSIAWIALSIMAILRAFNGERWRIPVVSDLSEKF